MQNRSVEPRSKRHAEFLRQIAGVVLIIFGLYVAGILRIPALDRERRFSLRFGQASYPASFAVGMAFGLGWTPCVGPILAGILLIAAQAATLQYGVLLLAVYSLGLGIPFLALGIGFETIAPRLKRLALSAADRARYGRVVDLDGGRDIL